MLKCVRRGLSLLAHSESGIAMPTVLTVTVISLGFGSVAAVSSISAQRGSVRDYDTKQALAAAEAGAERALYRYNKLLTTEEVTCLVVGTGGALIEQGPPTDGGGWCAPVTGSVGSSTYIYRVRPFQDGSDNKLEIVSTGTSDNVTRRIELTVRSDTGRVFGEFTVIGDEIVDMDSNSEITGNAATNGSFFLNSNSEICGAAQHGPGGGFNGDQSCLTQPPGAGMVNLPLVDQGDVPVNNSNNRFFFPTANPGDIRTGGNNVSWNASTRTLSMNSNSSLTLGGSNYSFCRLTMNSNSELIIAAGAIVKIYFDSPENCGLPSGTVQLDMNSNTSIVTTSGDPTHAQFLFVGSNTLQTRIELNSNSQACGQVIIYAPLTDIDLDSNSTICGAVAGNTIHMDSNAHVITDPRTEGFELPVPLHFVPESFVECTGVADDPPDADC